MSDDVGVGENVPGPPQADPAVTEMSEPAPPISLTRTVQLPSRGLLYDGKMPGGEVTVKTMTVKEEKILADPARDRSDILDLIISRCVPDLPIPYGELLLGDRHFLLLVIRSVSFGDDYSVVLRCTSCNSQFSHDIPIPDGIKVKVLTEADGEPFYADLPFTRKKVGLRLLRVRDEKEIERYAKQRLITAEPGDPAYSYRLAKHIVSIDDQVIQDLMLVEMIDNLPSKDSFAILDAIEDHNCGPDLFLSVTCPRCGQDIREVMPFTAEFFRPKRSDSHR